MAQATNQAAGLDALRQKLDRLEAYLAQDPGNTQLLADAFDAALQCGQWDRARFHLSHGQALQPADAAWALREGDFWLAQQRYDEATAVLERLAASAGAGSPLEVAVTHNLAFIDFRRGALAACVARLAPRIAQATGTQALPVDSAVQQLWLRAMHAMGELEPALQWAKDSQARGQLAPAVAGVASLIAFDADDFDAAARWAGLAGADDGGMEAQVTLGSLALAARNAQAALGHVQQALAINPHDGRALSLGAFACFLVGDLPAARAAFAQAVQAMPAHVETWHGQAWCQLLQQDGQGAIASFEAALALDADNAQSHGGLAVALALQQQAEPARAHLERALALDPANLAALHARAVLSGTAHDAQAVQDLAKAVLS